MSDLDDAPEGFVRTCTKIFLEDLAEERGASRPAVANSGVNALTSPRAREWSSEHRTAARVPADLTETRIVDTAVNLIEREGFGTFSMRRLAADLGVTATALYRHVPTRQHILDLVADRYFAEVVLVDSGDWKEFLTAFLRAVHRQMLDRPLLAEVLVQQPVDGVTALRLSNTILGRLRRAGFDGRTAIEILTNLGSFTIGFTLNQAGRAGTDAKDPVARAAWLREQTAELYPELAAVADDWVQWSVEQNFESGLRRLMDSYDKECRDAST